MIVAGAFYTLPYLALRNKVMTSYEEKYQVDAQTASRGFNEVLREETGSAGFPGYLKLRASEGESYINYLIVNSLPLPLFSYSLKSIGAWIYWIFEFLLFIIPCAWLSYGTGKDYFSISANDWYVTYPTQIGSVPLENKDRLEQCLVKNDLNGLSRLIVPEGMIKHPLLEIYRRTTRNKRGDILFTVKETFRKSQTTVKRRDISQWEVTQAEYETLLKGIPDKVA